MTQPSTEPPDSTAHARHGDIAARVTIRLEPDWDALEVSVERNASDTESFLDLATGKVTTIAHGEVEAAARRQQIAENLGGFLRVDPAPSREQYRWMERFVGSVADESLRDRLIMAIDGKGAFRRFKDVLLAYPAERERWFAYRAELLHWHIHTWLQEHGIEAISPPPWGEMKPPSELPLVTGKPVFHGAESPGESLRRQARELIEGIAAIDLPSVIAFLEFVRQRGAEALARSRTSAVDLDDDRDAELDGSADWRQSGTRGSAR